MPGMRHKSGAGNPAVSRVRACRTGGLALAVLMIGGVLTTSAGAASTNLKADQAYARTQLPTLSNLPSGWKKLGSVTVDTTAGSDSAKNAAALASCLGVTAPPTVVAAQATSPLFSSKDDSTQVIDAANVYKSNATAKAHVLPFKNPKFAGCFVQVNGSQLLDIEKLFWPSGTTFGTLSGSPARAPRYGDQSGMILVQIPVTVSQGSQTIDYMNVMQIRQGRSTANLLIDQANTPPSSSLTKSLAKTVTAKMKASPPRS